MLTPTNTLSQSKASSPMPADPSANPPTTEAITAPETSDISEDALNDPELAAYGLQVYHQQYCGVCHHLATANTGGLFGPPQDQIGVTAEQRIHDPRYKGVATTAAAYIRESILNPGIYLVAGYEQSRHHMPAFTHLSQAEVDALVAFLYQQR